MYPRARPTLRRIATGAGVLALVSTALAGHAAADDLLGGSQVPVVPDMAIADAGQAAGEIVPPPPTVRIWPGDQEIRLGYRLIGDYETLHERLRAAEPIGIGAFWEPAFDAIAEVDVEAELLDRIDHFAALTGLSITPERYDLADQSAPFDMCIEIYLSDRQEDETTFDCLLEMQERLAAGSAPTEAFTTWGFATTYGTNTTIRGAACFAPYSALTFRSEIFNDFRYRDPSVPRLVGVFRPAPFSRLSGQSPVGPIWGYRGGFFGTLRNTTGRTGPPRDGTAACQRTLRETYQQQINRIIDNCLVSMLGLPISDASPAAIVQRSDVSPYSSLRQLSEWAAGSDWWVSAVGYLTSHQYQETPRLRLLERRADDLLQALYGGGMTLATLQTFAAEFEANARTALAAGEGPARINLYHVIEEDCLGPE